MLKFSDGMEIHTEGKLRMIEEWDGFYVVGEGWCIPVNGEQEAEKVIARLSGSGKNK